MGRSPSRPHSPEQAIPARVVIGVTGHRALDTRPALRQGIHSALKMIRQMVPSLPGTPLVLGVLPPPASLNFALLSGLEYICRGAVSSVVRALASHARGVSD